MYLGFKRWRKENISNVLRLKSKFRNRQVILGSISIFVGIVILSMLLGTDLSSRAVSKFLPSQELALKSSTSNLDFSDFANVEKHQVPNAKTTVVFIPQIHKDPTTQANDPKNDQAAGIQKEISGMLDKLVNDHNVTYVMDETDLYGPMPQDKVAKIKQGHKNINEARASTEKLLRNYLAAGGSQSTADQIKKASEQKIASYERNIDLTGGAAVLAVTNPNAHVYGSQNEATIKEATRQLQRIVYMESRMNQLQPQQNPQGTGTSNTSSSSSTSILSMLGGSRSVNVNLQPVAILASTKEDQNLKDDIADAQSKLSELSTSANFETAPVASTQSADANQNPYANVSNLQQLTKEHDAAVTEFMKVAKDRRSQEATDNVVKMMETNGQKTSVLVMGQQHKDQLVENLNKQGVSVIVITPDSEVGVTAS